MERSYIKIGLDLDGCIRDFISKMIEVYQQHFPDKWFKQPDTWHLEEHFEIGKGIYDFISINQHEIFSKAPLIEGAGELIKKLDSPNYDIVIITNPWNNECKWSNIDWLANKFIPVTELYQTSNKKDVECDVYIDDHPKNILSYENRWEQDFKTFKKFLIVFDQPWNRESFRFAIRSFDHTQTFNLIESFRKNR